MQQRGATYGFNLGHVTCVSHAISTRGRNRIGARVYAAGRSEPFDLVLSADQFNELARAWARATGGAPMSDAAPHLAQ